MKALGLLLILMCFSACIPAGAPPSLSATPGAAAVVTRDTYRNDLFSFLKLGWELNSISNMKVLEGIFQTKVLRDFDETMQREGALYAGMSSAGPGFFAFSDSEEAGRKLAAVMEGRFSKYMGGMTVARAGEKMSIAMGKEYDRRNVTEKKVFTDAGGTVNVLTPAERAKWQEASKDAPAKMIKKMEGRGFTYAKAAYDDLQAQKAKVK